MSMYGITDHEASVICKEIGFSLAVDWFKIVPGEDNVLVNSIMTNLQCQDVETFSGCNYTTLETLYFKNIEILGLVCTPRPGWYIIRLNIIFVSRMSTANHRPSAYKTIIYSTKYIHTS